MGKVTDKKSTRGKVAPKPKSRAANRKTVTFSLHAPDAERVDFAGTLTNWELKPMKRAKDGIWKTTFRPAPGVYEYKFLIDHRWVEDPVNHDRVSDGHGGSNCVCRVE